MNIETRQDRIKSARNHAIAWDGRTTCVEVSINDTTADKFGYLASDAEGILEPKVKDGKRLNGLFLLNEHCPQADSISELEELCVVLKTDLLKLGNAKIRTEHQNAVRAHLNRDAESKKAKRQADSIAIQTAFEAGEIDAQEMMKRLATLIA